MHKADLFQNMDICATFWTALTQAHFPKLWTAMQSSSSAIISGHLLAVMVESLNSIYHSIYTIYIFCFTFICTQEFRISDYMHYMMVSLSPCTWSSKFSDFYDVIINYKNYMFRQTRQDPTYNGWKRPSKYSLLLYYCIAVWPPFNKSAV